MHELLLKLVQSPKLRPIYKRNLQLARVSSAFHLAPNTGEDVTNGEVNTVRLQELIRYIEAQASSPACFEDIKQFIELLDVSGIKHLTGEFLPALVQKHSNEDKTSNSVQVLSFKVQYFITTCSLAYSSIAGSIPKYKCIQCEAESGAPSCSACFTSLSQRGMELYKSITEESPDGYSSQPEILSELVILIAFCSIKLISSEQAPPYSPKATRHIFQAILLLEHQLAFNPKDSQLLLLLLQMHLLVGSAPRSRQLLEDLAVKRTIVDSLGPLFYDRLTTVSPNLLSPSDNIGWQVMDLLSSHYSVSLKLRMPRRLIDAFESESYSAVLDIPTYINDLRRSCTRAMSMVEETRSERLLGCPTCELFTEERYGTLSNPYTYEPLANQSLVELTDDLELKSVIDYGSFPSWESSTSAPIYARLRIGPVPTVSSLSVSRNIFDLTNLLAIYQSRRLHLSLLAEGFQDVMGYKPPTPYKVSHTSLPSDRTFVLESLSQISNSTSRFLATPGSDLTAPEGVYFDLINLLSTLIPLAAESSKSPAFDEASNEIIEASKAALETLRLQLPNQDEDSLESTIYVLGSMHGLAVYRDAAVAVSTAAQWILHFNDQEKERDRSGQSNLPKDAIARVKTLQSAASAALKDGKDRVAALKPRVQGSFQSQFKTWVWEGAEEIRSVVEDDIVADVAAYIRENVQGWQLVKWE